MGLLHVGLHRDRPNILNSDFHHSLNLCRMKTIPNIVYNLQTFAASDFCIRKDNLHTQIYQYNIYNTNKIFKLIFCTLLSHGVVWQKSFQILPFHHELCLHWPMKSIYCSAKKMKIFGTYDDYLNIKEDSCTILYHIFGVILVICPSFSTSPATTYNCNLK